MRGAGRRGSVLPPTGTVTFLFTDIEGSSRRWQEDPGMATTLARHDEILRGCVEGQRGYWVKHTGDGSLAAFGSASDAVAAAVAIQRALGREDWGDQPLRARVGIHTGEAEQRAGDYFGVAVNLASRIMDAAYGGQILISAAGRSLVSAEDVAFRDLGDHALPSLTGRYGLFQVLADGLREEFPPLRIVGEIPVQLPAPRTSFVGRTQAVAEVDRLLDDHRLLTLTGVGGCGKTRLAIEVARQASERFPGGVFFADLSLCTESAHVPRALGDALGLNTAAGFAPASPGPVEEDVEAFLGEGRCLVVLDNCEHLLEAAADLVDRLLDSCPGLHVLATSREALQVEGEWQWRVPSLTLPQDGGADSEAVELLVDRALAARADLDTDAQLPAFAEIAHRLDGIPLALELAAAAMAYLSPTEIAQRLDDRFRLLTGPARGSPRQRTLAAAIDWSHDLLDEHERELFRRLAVFAGSFTLEAAEGVCGCTPEALGSLVRKSLVSADESGAKTRYRLLETVRHYAQDRLVDAGEAEALRDRHRDWYLAWLEDFPLDQRWLDFRFQRRLSPDLENLRSALGWSRAQGRHDLVARLATSMLSLFLGGGYVAEGWEWLSYAKDGDLEPALGRAVELAMHNLNLIGLFEATDEILAFYAERYPHFDFAALPDDDPVGAMAACLRVNVLDLGYRLDLDVAEENVAEARRRAEATGLPKLRVYAAFLQSWVLLLRSDVEAALAVLDEAKSYPGGETDAWVLMSRAVAAHLAGRHDTTLAEAAALEDETSRTLPPKSAWTYMPAFLMGLGLAGQGDLGAARRWLSTAVERVRSAPRALPLAIADCAVGCAACAVHEGAPERASVLLAAIRGTPGFWLRSPASYAVYVHYRDLIRDRLDRETRRRCIEKGESMGVEEAIDAELARWEAEAAPASPPSRTFRH